MSDEKTVTDAPVEAGGASVPPPKPQGAEDLTAAGSRAVETFLGDGVTTKDSYAVSLEVFEGPLDLLLHLVRRHELDILDIPIAFITEKYIEYLAFARALDIEVAGEYLVMAATLAYLKSRELLPPDPNEEVDEIEGIEEGVDPREQLIRRLLEYERFRAAAEDLGARPVVGRDVFGRGGEVDVDPLPPGLAPVTLFKLADAYNRVLDRAKVRESHEVVLEPITVRERIEQLTLMLKEKERIDFETMFTEVVWNSERELRQVLVVTLMSILEMVKMGVMGVHQAEGSSSLELVRTVDAEQLGEVVQSTEIDEPEGSAGQGPAEAPAPAQPAADTQVPADAQAQPKPTSESAPTPESAPEPASADAAKDDTPGE